VLGAAVGIGAILAIHVLGRVGSFCSPIRSDSYVFASFGYRIAHGEVFYRDMSDAKPPGIFLLNAAVYRLADGGPLTLDRAKFCQGLTDGTSVKGGRAALIPIESLFMLLGYFAVYKVGADLYGRAVGLVLAVAGALAVNFFLLADYAVEGFNLAENYMVLTSAAAVWCYRRGYQADRAGMFFLTGALLGLGFVLKQTVLPLVAAIVVHRTMWCLLQGRRALDRRNVCQGRARTWGWSGLAMLGGACAAVLPFVLLVVAQGTAGKAYAAITAQAATRLARATAWPGRWDDLVPLWVPMGWSVVGLILWARSALSGEAAGKPPNALPDVRRPADDTSAYPAVVPGPADVSLLLIWLALECVMLVYLPQRAFHYYALSCLPVILCSGLIWVVLGENRRVIGRRRVRTALAAVAIWSIALARPAIDVLVPTAIARYRWYDAATDRAYFDAALKWGPRDLG